MVKLGQMVPVEGLIELRRQALESQSRLRHRNSGSERPANDG